MRYFQPLLAEYLVLLVLTTTVVGFTHVSFKLLTHGNPIRPFVGITLHADVGFGRSKAYQIARLLISMVFPMLTVLFIACFVTWSANHDPGWMNGDPILRNDAYAFIPLAYAVSYISLGVLAYAQDRNLAKCDWESIENDSRLRVREVLIADADMRAGKVLPVFVVGVPVAWALARFLQDYGYSSDGDAIFAILIVASAMAWMLLSSVEKLDTLIPHRKVISSGLEIIRVIGDESRPRQQRAKMDPPTSFGVARWRNELHRNGFDLARSLERSILGLRRRLPGDDYTRLRISCNKVAYLLRKYSIAASSEEHKETYLALVRVAIAIVCAENPLAVSAEADRLTTGEPEQEEKTNKLLLFLVKLNEHVEASWNTVKIAGSLVTIVVFLMVGKWANIAAYFLANK